MNFGHFIGCNSSGATEDINTQLSNFPIYKGISEAIANGLVAGDYFWQDVSNPDGAVPHTLIMIPITP